MAYPLNKIAGIIKAETQGPLPGVEISRLLTDSRKLVFPEQTLFFALPGITLNGAFFIDELYQNGVRSFVVHTSFVPHANYPAATFLKVDDVLIALQQLAGYHRHQFNIPVIGITGSNGKTIVKEWLNHLLAPEFDIVRSPKSYNSQIGVPLSVWQMNPNHTLGIFEAGISRPGEMDKLEKIIQPQWGVFTFMGEAHAEGFENMLQKAEEKLRLFKNSQLLFYCEDEEVIAQAVEKFISATNHSLETFTWGKSSRATVQVKEIQLENTVAHISLLYHQQPLAITIPFRDEASVHNAITCLCVLLHFKIAHGLIKERMKTLRTVEMRLELKQGINNCAIINDSYSADLNSFSIALDFLQQQEQYHRRTVVLSDLLQSGREATALYTEIAGLLAGKNLYRFIGIGPQIQKNAKVFSAITNKKFYNTTEDFIEELPILQLHNETILLKGARVFRFEKISRALEQKQHETVLEINLNALRHNYNIYKQQLLPGVKLMAMVKAFGYGAGSYEVAALLQHAGANYLGVAYADEGVELRKEGIVLPIMVMNTEEAGFDHIVKYNLEPEIYSFRIFQSFKNYLLQHQISSYKVHIKLDTGMNRLGFKQEDLPGLIEAIQKTPQFHIQSVFSHLVASEDPLLDQFTLKQFELYKKMAGEIAKTCGYPFIQHLGNSSAISRFKSMQLDMVRLGIGLYGIDANWEIQKQLQNVTTLKTTISQIRKAKAGETVGYNRKAVLTGDSLIATVRIGYADGYFRLLGNGNGKMLVNGKLAPVIGNVCMDMVMLDITGINAEEEDTVIVFGEDLPVTQVAEWAGTIPYEILCGVSQRVRRVYFEE